MLLRTHGGQHQRNKHEAPNPALNVRRRNKPVSTNTIKSDTPTVEDCGHRRIRCASLGFILPRRHCGETLDSLVRNFHGRAKIIKQIELPEPFSSVAATTICYSDNQSVVTNPSGALSKLNKKHNSIAFHRVHEACAGKWIKVAKVDTKSLSRLLF